jgi:hypothetical protein
MFRYFDASTFSSRKYCQTFGGNFFFFDLSNTWNLMENYISKVIDGIVTNKLITLNTVKLLILLSHSVIYQTMHLIFIFLSPLLFNIEKKNEKTCANMVIGFLLWSFI